MPLVGTWIEIVRYRICFPRRFVVPLVGTWIEIPVALMQIPTMLVVPLVGTWIEIVNNEFGTRCYSRAPRGHVD